MGDMAPWPDSEEAGRQKEGRLAAPRDPAGALGMLQADEAMVIVRNYGMRRVYIEECDERWHLTLAASAWVATFTAGHLIK